MPVESTLYGGMIEECKCWQYYPPSLKECKNTDPVVAADAQKNEKTILWILLICYITIKFYIRLF
ncbi:MAG: hypothetical protein D8M57_12965 [Candidatus Scalindua sp. AMX11]|nr:MAG: hypothetical protein DWQ00_12125 [Candidatus Scalindua sp.]TDE64406.1 MAG: hypothetical protein D8M57_12965 [Candidatus Scalindua sp. AMX11]